MNNVRVGRKMLTVALACLLALLPLTPALADGCSKGEHTPVTDPGHAPTCYQSGLTEGSHCAVCGKVLVEREPIKGRPHTVVYDDALAPTCTEYGLTKGFHCGVCKLVVEPQHLIMPRGHVEVVDEAVAATCLTDGLTSGLHCGTCGEVLRAQEVVPAPGHTPVADAAVAAACTETGLTEGSHCVVCGEVLVAQEIVPATGHTEVIDETVAPTCTTEGLTQGSHCTACGTVFTAQEIIPMVEHTYVTDAAVAATCTATGLTEGSHCEVCGLVKVAQETVPMLPHTEVTDAAVEPTCDVPGKTEGSHCDVCGLVLRAQEEVPVVPHTEVIIAGQAATCTEEGYTESVRCSVCCRMLIPSEVLPTVPHTNTVEEIPATCVAEGGKRSTCNLCGSSELIEVMPKLDHACPEPQIIAPTCTERGYTLYNCPECGEIRTDYVEALGHTGFTLTPGADNAHSWQCERCGLSVSGTCESIRVLTNEDLLTLCAHCMGITADELYEMAVSPFCPLCGRFGDGHVETTVLTPVVDPAADTLTITSVTADPFPGVLLAVSIVNTQAGHSIPLNEMPSVVFSATVPTGSRLVRVIDDVTLVDVEFIQDTDSLIIPNPENGLYLLLN